MLGRGGALRWDTHKVGPVSERGHGVGPYDGCLWGGAH